MSKDRDFKAEAQRIIAEAEAAASRRTADRLKHIRENVELELPANRRSHWQQVHAEAVLSYRKCKAWHSNLSLLPDNRANLTAMLTGLLERQAKGIDTTKSIEQQANRAIYCEANRLTAEAIAAELEAPGKNDTPDKPEGEQIATTEADSLTTWQRCMYYRYLLEGGAPTPFDNDRKKEEAYNELAERHGGRAAHWKNTWLDTTKLRRKHESKRKKEGLKKVLKLLEEYPDAYRLCEMELRNAGIL